MLYQCAELGTVATIRVQRKQIEEIASLRIVYSTQPKSAGMDALFGKGIMHASHVSIS
jgi:hypothetical protein